jgi:hypothetical protein
LPTLLNLALERGHGSLDGPRLVAQRLPILGDTADPSSYPDQSRDTPITSEAMDAEAYWIIDRSRTYQDPSRESVAATTDSIGCGERALQHMEIS